MNQPKVGGAKANTGGGTVEIIVRQATGTYVARAKGHGVTASCTESARQAAFACARKLGLDPALLQEQPDLLGGQQSLFIHAGVVCAAAAAQEGASHD